MPKRIRQEDRLCDVISLRVSPRLRSFLERTADGQKIALCEVARVILNDAMARAGVEE